MKNLLVLLMVFALVGSASAWGLADAENPYTFSGSGNLTDQNPDVWGTWGGDSGGTGSVVVADGVCTFTTNSYELGFAHDNALADIGNPVPGVDNVEIHFDVISISGGDAIIKIEMFPEAAAFPNPDNGTGFVRVDTWEPEPIAGPGHYSFSTADKGGPIDIATVAITSTIGCTGTDTVFVIDNLWIGKAGTFSVTKATEPVPGNGDVVSASLATLSWTNPDPNIPTDTITSDVYLLDAGLSELTGDPNLGPDMFAPGIVQLADDTADEMVAVPALTEGHYYYWSVHCTDPHADPNGPVTTKGDVWSMFVGDTMPVVDAGEDQYNWVAKDDGYGNPLEYTITVTGTYTDDGKSPIMGATFVNPGWAIENGEDGILKVSENWDQTPNSVHTEGTVTAVYKTVDGTTAIPGYWNLELQVTDAAGTSMDAVFVRVDADCGAATAADPDDTFDGYYDINSDCVVDTADLLDFAEAWLNQSVKYE